MHAELEQESKDNLAESLDDEEYFAKLSLLSCSNSEIGRAHV